MELLNDSYEKEMAVGELTRINHGILVDSHRLQDTLAVHAVVRRVRRGLLRC